jgi:hypothetical protein
MNQSQGTTEPPRVLRAGEGDIAGDPAAVRDRFMIDGDDAGGRFALVQHLFPPERSLCRCTATTRRMSTRSC